MSGQAGASRPSGGGSRWAKDSLRNPLTYVRTPVDVARDLGRWHSGGPSGRRTYLALRVLHRHTAGVSSQAALAALRLVPGSPDRGSGPHPPLAEPWLAPLARLHADGITYVPDVLDATAIARIRELATTGPATVRSGVGPARPGTYSQRGERAHAVTVLEQFVLAQPDVQGLIANPTVAEFARRHFGIGAVIHPPMLYWSCVGPTPGPELSMQLARRYHWDYDGVGGLRLHLYLTDVDEQSAPMQYLAGSQRAGRYRTRALQHGDMGVEDAAVWRSFDRSATRTMTGPAGTTFVSDSAGLHRGTDPVSRDRLFLVMPMQATGFAGYQLRPRTVPVRHPALAAALVEGRPELRMFRAADR